MVEKWRNHRWFAGAVALLVIAFSILIYVFPIESDDLMMYLAVGKKIVAAGKLIDHDPFLFSRPDSPWVISHHWLGMLMYYGAYQWLGLGALTILKGLVLTLTALLPFVLMRSLIKVDSTAIRSAPLVSLVGSVSFLSIYAGSLIAYERTNIVTTAFTTLVLVVLLIHRVRRIRALPAMSLVFALWVNLHAGFHIGLCVLGMVLVVDFFQRRSEPGYRDVWVTFLLSCLACLLNPRGLQGFLYPIQSVLSSKWDIQRQYNFEWFRTFHPVYRNTPQVLAFSLLSVVVGISVILRLRKHLLEFALFAFFLFFGISAIRWLPVSGAVFSVLFVSVVSSSGIASRIKGSWMLQLGACVAMSAALIYVGLNGYEARGSRRVLGLGPNRSMTYFPIETAEFVRKSGIKGPILNDYDFGSYFAWAWEGDPKIFIYGVVEESELTEEYVNAVYKDDPSGFDQLVKRYGIGAVILGNSDNSSDPTPPLFTRLSESKEWKRIHSDLIGVVFVRADDSAISR